MLGLTAGRDWLTDSVCRGLLRGAVAVVVLIGVAFIGLEEFTAEARRTQRGEDRGAVGIVGRGCNPDYPEKILDDDNHCKTKAPDHAIVLNTELKFK